MILKNSRRSFFLAAKNYPKVKIAKNIPKNILEELKNKFDPQENKDEN
jgi:hypothetical protein